MELEQEQLPQIKAMGFSQSLFDAKKPGKLCRGRERWIEPFEIEGEVEAMHRLVISGARFSDDSARDAVRGLHHAGVDIPKLITTLFPRKKFIAFMEDGHPADIPEKALGIEAYEGYRAGGRSQEGLVRWYQPCSGLREIRDILGDNPRQYSTRIRGLGLLAGNEDLDELWEELFPLVGMSSLDSPPAQYQPSALPELLAKLKAVVLFHRDKHGPAIGIYSRESIDVEGKLQSACGDVDALLVPFAVPPMLARWDRAISELKQVWQKSSDEPFPVPESPEPSDWQSRRRRDRRGRRAKKEAAAAQEVEEVVLPQDEVDAFLMVAGDEE